MALLGLATAQAATKTYALHPTTGASRAAVGIADQKVDMFGDARFAELGIRRVRRSVAWDVLRTPWQAAELQAWLDEARRVGAQPLITFARSRVAARLHRPPTASQFATEFARFHRRFPAVRTFSAWNEANHCGEGTCHKPELVAQYYKAIRRSCATCTILAADLLDQPNIVSWARAFRKAAGVEPRYWGLHNYVGANRRSAIRTVALLRAVKGDVWLTETGGLVARRNRSTTDIPEGVAHAANVTSFILNKLARMSRRITRIYLYHWNSTSPTDSWDSALIGSDGVPRPAFTVLQKFVDARR